MRKPIVHLVCNAHLDPVWQWEWEEGACEALSTFRTAADLCEESESFVFNHNEVILYKWVEQYEPELFNRIRRLVKAGKWHIMGGWYLQPDCNMPSGEGLVRQIIQEALYKSSRRAVMIPMSTADPRDRNAVSRLMITSGSATMVRRSSARAHACFTIRNSAKQATNSELSLKKFLTLASP